MSYILFCLYFRYSLLGDNIGRFHVDSDTGLVTTSGLFDREEISVYYLTLVAQDCSITDPRATAVNLTITVEDENDNTPKFSTNQITVHIPDRIQPGQFVYGAKAYDEDSGNNSLLSYSISGEDAKKFIINPNTGVVKTTEELRLRDHGSDDTFYELSIKVSDSGKSARSSNANLIVKLWPAHLFPVITSPKTTQFTAAEDTPAGKVITKVVASSPKPGLIGGIRYSIAGGNVGDALKMDLNTGEVAISGVGLDYETSRQYEVWVEARDSDMPSLRSVIELVINVSDANDNAPVMEESQYYPSVLEEEYPPVKVISVKALDKDSGKNGKVSYTLSDDCDGAFSIDADTGEIFTNSKLDREDIDSYRLIVKAMDEGIPQLTGTATISVSVLDKNDNPPRFTRLFSVNVTENAEPGSFVIRVTSSDLDIGENANATYLFTENPGNKFAIDALTGNVTVVAPLDREVLDEYVLKVAAVDGSWRAETPLTITIQDQNDNIPEFEKQTYVFNFPELQKHSMFVGQVIATDRDKQGPNSIISYSLKHPSDIFSIDPTSGELFSKRGLKFKFSGLETSPENQYVLTVVASDNGRPPLSTECQVTVNIIGTNISPPKFESREYFSPVPDKAMIGHQIIKVSAKDTIDFGVNAEIEYFKVGGNGSDMFNVNKNTGWITLAKALENKKLLNQFTIQVKAVDLGVPPQYDQVPVTLVLTGENRYSPVFPALSYQVIVPENEPINSTILTVSAHDSDEGPNGMVRYSLSNNPHFNIHPISGAITIVQPLDYDTVQENRLNVTATDMGFQPRRTTAMLTVLLTDVNDNPPKFDLPEYEAYLPENSLPKTLVYNIKATDIDSAKNSIIHYSIVGGSGKEYFMIDLKTGSIFSKVKFDFEEKNLYTLDILAVNPESPMYGSTKVLIHITGVNEYYPKFIQPVFHFDVLESADIGTNVGTIQAIDQDGGDDGKVYYIFVMSSNDKGFAIGYETGDITVSRRLDRETQNRVILTVMAKNFGGIKGNDTDEAQVIISIQDGNDPPEFLEQQYNTEVSEGVAVGTKVLTVKAIDKDVKTQNNQFSYSIINGNSNNSFKIDYQTGDIETASVLDRETIATYTLTIGAIDTGVPPETGTATVKITVEDINDHGPELVESNFQGSIMENEPPHTSVMTLAATDPDLPPNGGPFTFELVGGKHRDLFTLERHSGVIRTSAMLDRESTPQLEILVSSYFAMLGEKYIARASPSP